MPSLSLIIPVFNEARNIGTLLEQLAVLRDRSSGCPFEVWVVDNGSLDESAKEIRLHSQNRDWIRVLTLSQNIGYGGGIRAGISRASLDSTHIGWLPGDLQYQVEDLGRVWSKVLDEPDAVHKGNRTRRKDSYSGRVVSTLYSALVKSVLGLPVVDINGLPKIFPVRFLKTLESREDGFLFDVETLLAAHRSGLVIREHSVAFENRKHGLSSWSSRRIHTYVTTIQGLMQMRKTPS